MGVFDETKDGRAHGSNGGVSGRWVISHCAVVAGSAAGRGAPAKSK
jgi:hypothetical protein